MRPVRMVVGVGNPGRRYAGTRHNLGFDAVALAAEKLGVRLARPFWSSWRVGPSRWALTGVPTGACLLLQPLTFVNLTGVAVERAVRWSGVAPAAVLVLCDDMNLPPGRIRIRPQGSDGGHRGLRSVAAALGTEAFPRLRMGIGPPEEGAVDHVLGAFPAGLAPLAGEMVERAATAAAEFARGAGLEALMNRFNG